MPIIDYIVIPDNPEWATDALSEVLVDVLIRQTLNGENEEIREVIIGMVQYWLDSGVADNDYIEDLIEKWGL
jgi:glycosidase